MTPETIQKMIDASISDAMSFATKKYGDTPTDALQLVPKKYVDGRGISYAGAFSTSAAILSPFPTGWSVNKTGTGKYTVTHNLGATNYVVVVLPINYAANVDNVCITIPTRGANSFTIEVVQSDLPGTYINTDLNFIVSL